MSLRDLKDEIYLVLQVKGGHGFGFATAPLLITASLAGNTHESFVIEPCPQPKFENEFVWVMDKAKMKSIWAEKVPVRIECYTVKSHRSRIGYTILNVKDAQVILHHSKITEKQVRLLGLSKDVSSLKPELFLSFYITDAPTQCSQLIPQFWPPLEDSQVRMANGVPKVSLGSGKDHFIISISPQSITNLKELLPSQSEVEAALLTYKYSLLGAEVVSDVSTNHSVSLALTSSLACLRAYFQRQPAVTVQLYMGTLLIGETAISVENLLISEEFLTRRTKQQARLMSCKCVVTPAHKLESPVDSRPSVDFTISFSYDIPVVKKNSEVLKAPSVSSLGAGGDADNKISLLPLEQPVTKSAEGGGSTYRASQPVSVHTVTVTLINLQPRPAHCWLRLSCPCASVSPPHQLCVADSWSPVHWQLSLALPQRLLQTTLTTQPAVLQLGVAEQLIGTAVLLPPDILTVPSEKIAVLVSGEEKVGQVNVAWSSDDLNSHSAASATLTDPSLSPPSHTQQTSHHAVMTEVMSPRSRELKILSFVEELEDWAEKQRIMVMEGLKEEEAARLASLQSRWEEEVGGQMSEGRQLVDALHHMRDQLKAQEEDLRDKQHKMKVYKEELERVHRSKLQEFKDLSRRMQDEFNHKLALIAADKVALERQVEELRQENAEVKHRLREGEEDKRRADRLSHELKVLTEKLSMEQESKKFFKEHCRKAEQEIHRLNNLRHQDLQARLHSEKKSLEQLAFQHIVVERNDLRQDQRLLEEIRQQLLQKNDNSDFNSNSNSESAYTEGRPFTDERHIRRAT